MNMDYDLFMEEIKRTARAEMEAAGYEQLRTPEEVEEAFARPGTTLVMVNSVCGCAGGIARPAAANAIHYDKRPNHLVTVFAGQDKEATAAARYFFGDNHIPSSPSFVLLKDGKVVADIGRHEIEGHDPMSVITNLQANFEEFCEEV
ncbi:BrxA/BrxB family bacilliredoxin [Lysinibacillus endophyticus]|uniref:BrxA/BrxB family bacilliredoxin n=1 Tax=Ureibacillus endophyticus TaxID=1978490 RepID=A0A494Z0B6_9BACL|nr:BrxA/BrxB family bacilliredoxin [Lysinibacillus endophyticus]MCP1145164.1 BrxA/BrxB family bacilliredoxin [Lysinibacillus endophyticus]RKQ15935.1 BrxA/BrxB family bacilliredoxin [Lysinibacillus endophyticus]